MKIQKLIYVASVSLILSSCASNKVDVDSVGGLREANKLIELAEKDGAKKYAPTTLKEARASLDNAAKITHDNPNGEEVQAATNDAYFAAERLVHVTRQSRKIADMKPELVVLNQETDLSNLRAALELEDQRNLAYEDQLANIQSSLNQTVQLGAQAKQLQGETSKNKKQLASLQQQKEYNDKFQEVRKNFSPEEAEVFREGDAVVVRLKQMEFPSGKAEIPTQNFAVLNKIQKTIGLFEEANVVVAGHTDSTGSVKKNKALSLSRAEAVKEYLVANEAVDAESVKAVGYGADKPLASNTTAEGRAENRRVDVIIHTTAQVAE